MTFKILFEDEPGPHTHIDSELYYKTVITLSDKEAAALGRAITSHQEGSNEALVVDFRRGKWKLMLLS